MVEAGADDGGAASSKAAVQAYVDDMGGFMEEFSRLVSLACSECKPSSFGLPSPPVARIRQRPDRVALQQAYRHLHDLHTDALVHVSASALPVRAQTAYSSAAFSTSRSDGSAEGAPLPSGASSAFPSKTARSESGSASAHSCVCRSRSCGPIAPAPGLPRRRAMHVVARGDLRGGTRRCAIAEEVGLEPGRSVI